MTTHIEKIIQKPFTVNIMIVIEYINFPLIQFTLWDRIGGSFRSPSAFENDSPLDQLLRSGSGKGCASQKKNRSELE